MNARRERNWSSRIIHKALKVFAGTQSRQIPSQPYHRTRIYESGTFAVSLFLCIIPSSYKHTSHPSHYLALEKTHITKSWKMKLSKNTMHK